MASSVPPLVLHRDRRWLWRLGLRFLLAAVAVGLMWMPDGLPLPLRAVLAVLSLALALRPPLLPLRTVTLDEEGLRRGYAQAPWSALTSVRLGAPAHPGKGPPLGSVTLHFGDAAMSFDRDWPLESLLVEVLARAPLEAQLDGTARVPLDVRRPAPTQAPPRQPAPRRWTKEGVNPLPFMMMLGGAGPLLLGLGVMREAVASREWQAVPAVVTLAQTWKAPTGPNKKMVEHGSIRFRFVVNGVEREGDQFDHFGTDANQVERLKVGQQVTAYVPADNPGRAVLDRDIPAGSYLLIFFGGLLTGPGALWVLWGLRRS
jgi:hypothetical protein